jgi:hypothetical protein
MKGMFTPGFVELVLVCGIAIGAGGAWMALLSAHDARQACNALRTAVELEQAAEHYLWAVQGIDACK